MVELFIEYFKKYPPIQDPALYLLYFIWKKCRHHLIFHQKENPRDKFFLNIAGLTT